jgi:hypothetical protein
MAPHICLAVVIYNYSLYLSRRGPSVHEMDIGEQLEKIQSEGKPFS